MRHRPRAGNLLAGMVTLRHAAGLPKAVRDLHANWLLECRASEKVRIPAAMMEKRASRIERAHAGMYAHESMRKVTRTE